MSISRGEVKGFLVGQIAAGKTSDEAKKAFTDWLNAQTDATATDDEKGKILSDLDSYIV